VVFRMADFFNKRYGKNACLHCQSLNNYHHLAGDANSC
jgi:hypothetical protein